MPKFSVVISVYNKEKYISKTLESVLSQSLDDFEIVILNDGSTDNSEAEILKLKDPRIRYFSEENQGAGAGRNYVIKKAKAEYIALLDADDIWFPFYLEEQNQLMESFPQEYVFAVGSKIYQNGRYFKKTYSLDENMSFPKKVNYFKASLRDSVLHSSTAVIHKSVFEEVGFYDPTIKSGQDTDLYIRIGLKYKIVFDPKVCAVYNVILGSLFQSTKKVGDKLDLSEYSEAEKSNPELKLFLDLNRYSLCLLAILEGNKTAYQENYNAIDLKNLTKRQKFLLGQNASVLRLLVKTKNGLSKMGLRLSAFR